MVFWSYTETIFCFQFSIDLIPVKEPATFHISVSGGGAAELAVSVRGSHGNELPVRIKGDVQNGFIAEFTPTTVGAHTINVEYNGYAVQVMHINKIESYLNICIECIRDYEYTTYQIAWKYLSFIRILVVDMTS